MMKAAWIYWVFKSACSELEGVFSSSSRVIDDCSFQYMHSAILSAEMR